MDPLNREALDSLAAAIRSFLPAAGNPAHASSVAVFPSRITSTGLGGFVGLHHEPEGEVVGRQIDADVRVTVRAAAVGGLTTVAEAAAQALVGAGRKELGEKGILDLSFTQLGEARPLQGETPAEQELAFRVRYEFLKVPTEAGDVIREIPIQLEVGS